jgi:hypothetical protein
MQQNQWSLCRQLRRKTERKANGGEMKALSYA